MQPEWKQIREQFRLPADTIYLNNGSFGPCPEPVLQAALTGITDIDSHPGEQLSAYRERRDAAKQILGRYLGMRPEDFVFVTNVTVGMNMIARGLRSLQTGDEILTTSQEYGAVNNIWQFVARKRGAKIKRIPFPEPAESPEQLIELVSKHMTNQTRVIYISHITTTTGLITPIREICRKARERGILTAVDGAHAPGLIPLDVNSLGCDFYTGNCHKWLCAPKGTAFLWAAPEAQDLLDPLIVGWGWDPEDESFLGNFENPGTHSIALPAAVSAAVRFQESIGQDRIVEHNRNVTAYGRTVLQDIPGVRLLTPDRSDMSCALSAYALPKLDVEALTARLRERGIIIPHGPREGYTWLRLSTHIYNTRAEIDILSDAIRAAPA